MSILLVEDMAIVPLLALVAFLAPIVPGSVARPGIDWLSIAIGLASIAGLSSPGVICSIRFSASLQASRPGR